MLAIGGVWHIAWTETDGHNFELRVARLNAVRQPLGRARGRGEPDQPVAQRSTPSGPAWPPSAARPYVAWTEATGTYDSPLANPTSYAVHVARLNTSGSDWQHVVRGDGPIAEAPAGRSAPSRACATSAACRTSPGASSTAANSEIRVARLEPELLDATETTTGPSGALLQQRVRTYGVPYPIGVSVDDDEPVLSRYLPRPTRTRTSCRCRAGDLAPGSSHHPWQAFGWDGAGAHRRRPGPRLLDGGGACAGRGRAVPAPGRARRPPRGTGRSASRRRGAGSRAGPGGRSRCATCSTGRRRWR